MRQQTAAKKDMRHTSVLFARTTKSLFLTPCISITTGQIYIFYVLHTHDITYHNS